MMAFNPFNAAQLQTPIKADESNAEALRLLASNNFLQTAVPPVLPQVPVDALRAMVIGAPGLPFPFAYPAIPQDFKPELFSAGGGPMAPFMIEGFGFHPYADGARRKNATRETTAPLKEWLNGHRTNPYPTKAEKIYLAVMTKMTLTQVSTWFANARRRLKKENGGNVSMKRRDGEEDDDDMAELDRPSSSTSNMSGGSNIKDELEVDEKEHNENIKVERISPSRDDLTPRKKMLSIDDILAVKDEKKDEEATSSKKDSPSSEESVPGAAQFAAFQQMMAMYRNPQLLAAMAAQRGPGGGPFYPFNPLMMSMAMPTTPTGNANGSFTSEATSASPSSSHSPAAASEKESSPQPAVKAEV